MNDVIVKDLGLICDGEHLVLRGVVANEGDREIVDVAISWHGPAEVERLATDTCEVVGAGADASCVLIAPVVAAGESVDIAVPLRVRDGVGSVVRLTHVGLGYCGVSRALEDLECNLPGFVRIDVGCEVSGVASDCEVARVKVRVRNTGRSVSPAGSVAVDLSDGLCLLDRVRGFQLYEYPVPELTIGEAYDIEFGACVREAVNSGDAICAAVVHADGNELARTEFVVPVDVVPRLDLAVRPQDGEWSAGSWRDVDIHLRNSGIASASAVDMILRPVGGVSVDVAAGPNAVSASLESSERVLRVRIEDLPGGESTCVRVRVQAPFRRLEAAPALSVEARHKDKVCALVLPLRLDYVPRFDANQSGFVSTVVDQPAGTIARLPVRISNIGAAVAQGVWLDLDLDPALTLVGVEDARATVEGNVYYAGDIPPGYVHENALLVRIGAVFAGSNELAVSAVVRARNCYGVVLQPATIRARGEVAVVLDDLRASEDGEACATVCSIGDAVAKHLGIYCALPAGVRVAERSTRIEGALIADNGGESVLTSEGVNVRQVEPGARIRVSARLVGDVAEPTPVDFFVVCDGIEITRQTVDVVPIVVAPAPRLSGAGFVLDHPIVEESSDASLDAHPDVSNSSRSVQPAVPSAASTPDDLTESETAVLPSPASAIEGVDAAEVSVSSSVVATGGAALDASLDSGSESGTLSSVDAVGETAGGDAGAVVDEEMSVLALSTGADVSEPGVVGLDLNHVAGDVTHLPDADTIKTVHEHSMVETISVPGDTAGVIYTQRTPVCRAVLPITPAWVRGVVTTLSPLIRSHVRELSMHAMAVRLFLPERFVDEVQIERRAELAESFAALQSSFRRDTVMAAGMAETASFVSSEPWLARVESPSLVSAARGFVRALDGALFTGVDVAAADDKLLIATVDYQNLGGVERRYNSGDALATTWVFTLLFPTMCGDSAMLSDALARYRKSLEAVLWEVPPSDGLQYPVSIELDDELGNLHDALRGYASVMGVSVAA